MYSPSISYEEKSEPFELQVARGHVPGHSLVNIQGFNTAMPSSFRTPWELANTVDYVYPTSELAMNFTSSASETLTVTVQGLDVNYVIKTATVTFSNSTTGVVTSGTNTFFRINAMQVTSGTNAGAVSATNGGVTYAQIAIGLGRSQAAIYTVPKNHAFYLTRAQAFTTNNGNQYCTYRVYSETIVNGVVTPNIVLRAPFTQSYTSARVVARQYVQKTDIQWQLNQSSPAPGSVQVEGILIEVTPS
jgi:hypothetical protein